MYNYDFKILNYNEFECFTRDLIQAEEGIRVESFADGRDAGVDLRFAYDNKKTCVVQCKRYKEWSELKSKLKEEVAKVKKLNPKRYILSTTVDLTANNKDEIKTMFAPYIQDTATDILAKADLNNLLANHSDIEKQYYKLWLGSTEVLNTILHRNIINWSEFESDAIQTEIAKYVSNDSLKQALDILHKNRYVIISGIPGIGKTTLARMLVYQFLAKDYEEFVYVVDDLDMACNVYDQNRKQIFFFDDFLGSNAFVPQSTSFENKLMLFINRVKKSRNALFIMTTREYILSEAKSQYEKIALYNIELAKCTLDLSHYTQEVRARILYNHLVEAQLPIEYIDALLDGKGYASMVNHKNFNPRVIEGFINKQIWESTPPNKFLPAALDYFDKPLAVWAKAFQNLDAVSRYALLVFATLRNDVSFEEWRSAFMYFCDKSRASLGLFYDDNTWLKSVKVLQDCFIKTEIKDKERKVYPFNPSILDFCASYIRENQNTMRLLLEGAYYPEQLTTVFTDNLDACQATGNQIEVPEDMFGTFDIKRQEVMNRIKERVYPRKNGRNEVNFSLDIIDKFPVYNRRYCGSIEKDLSAENFYEPTIDSSTRFDLLRKLDCKKLEWSPLDTLYAISTGETLYSSEWIDCAETIQHFGGFEPDIESVIVDHIEAGIKDEVDNTSSSADCDEISDSVRELGHLVASWCNSSMLDYISVKEQRLREEEEAMDYPDDREYYPLQGGNDSSQMDEMFSSLREEAMNRNKL